MSALTLAGLRMRNFKCFAGETVLVLRPALYSVVARDAEDAERSNWLGKSSLTEAVDFALTGRLPRSCHGRKKTDWVTEGEKSGEVDLALSSGARVVRSQSLTTSEKLLYFPPGEPEKGAMGDAAQAMIDEALGLAREDAGVWSFRQGEMARLLKMDSGELAEIFSHWLRLARLDECSATSSRRLADACRRRDDAVAAEKSARTAAEDALRRAGAADGNLLAEAVAAVRAQIEGYAAAYNAARARVEAAGEKGRLEADARRYEAVVERGRELRASLDAQLPREAREAAEAAARAKMGELAERKGVAESEHAAASSIATGGFDGRCPLVGDACPAPDFVTRARVQHGARLERAKRALAEVSGLYEAEQRTAVEAATAIRQREREERALEDLRGEARRLKPAHERWRALPDPAGLTDAAVAAAEARREYDASVSLLQQLERELAVFEDARRRVDESAALAAERDREARTAAAGAAVFERARRRIGEEVFADVEGLAVSMLAAAGIDLDVRVAWGREGRDLADHCGACGEPFPASKKVRECRRCGAARGPKWVDRLDVEVRGRPTASGAADDLAGAMLQFATSRWLREDRESQWGLAMLDEPFGQMDAANRRALSSALPGVLRACGFSQALVIAHHAGVLDALPGRIEVTSSGGRSAARVVA